MQHEAKRFEAWFYLLCFVLVLAFLLCWVIGSSMEAGAYNRVTGSSVSTWDAMWIELRVQDAPKD